jgi:CHAD domain-containing protein
VARKELLAKLGQHARAISSHRARFNAGLLAPVELVDASMVEVEAAMRDVLGDLHDVDLTRLDIEHLAELALEEKALAAPTISTVLKLEAARMVTAGHWSAENAKSFSTLASLAVSVITADVAQTHRD